MFRIPTFHKVPENSLSFDDAVSIIKFEGKGDLLKGMKFIDAQWDKHVNETSLFDSDDEFFDNYGLEVNAYNIIFKGFSKLLLPINNKGEK